MWLHYDGGAKVCPIFLFRKPFKGTLVDNVLKYGVGGLNIDECRLEPTGEDTGRNNHFEGKTSLYMHGLKSLDTRGRSSIGRFPANLILTHNEKDKDGVCGGFPNTPPSGGKVAKKGEFGYDGSAARYFYNAKTYTELLQYLIRLVTPKGGKIYTPSPSDELAKAVEEENTNGAGYFLFSEDMLQ